MQGLRNPGAVSYPLFILPLGEEWWENYLYETKKKWKQKRDQQDSTLLLSPKRLDRVVFTCFLQLQKFLWLLLRYHLEEFHEKKRGFLTGVASLLLRLVLCTLIGMLINSSTFTPNWLQVLGTKGMEILIQIFHGFFWPEVNIHKGCRILYEAYVKIKTF